MPGSPISSVAVIIPCFGHARVLGRAIKSVLAQTVLPAEIIVVDDGSLDDPAAVARSYPQVRLIPQENRGPSAARNRGLGEATSDKLIFLDADDVLLPNAVEAGLTAFRACPDAAFVYGAFSNKRWFGLVKHLHRPTGRLHLLRENSVGMIGAAMFDRARLLEVGGFDEQIRIAEDWDLYLRLSRRFPFVGHGQLVACYTRHRGNVTNDIKRMRAGIETVRQLEWQRGLAGDEATAWRDGKEVIASAYPTFARRLMRLGRRLIGLSGPRAPRR